MRCAGRRRTAKSSRSNLYTSQINFNGSNRWWKRTYSSHCPKRSLSVEHAEGMTRPDRPMALGPRTWRTIRRARRRMRWVCLLQIYCVVLGRRCRVEIGWPEYNVRRDRRSTRRWPGKLHLWVGTGKRFSLWRKRELKGSRLPFDDPRFRWGTVPGWCTRRRRHRGWLGWRKETACWSTTS